MTDLGAFEITMIVIYGWCFLLWLQTNWGNLERALSETFTLLVAFAVLFLIVGGFDALLRSHGPVYP